MTNVDFNGTSLSKLFSVVDVSRPLAEYRDASTKVEGADGEAFDALTIGVRECSFSVVACNKSKQGLHAAARTLAKIVTVREPSKLMFSDEVDDDGTRLYRLAVPVGTFDYDEFVKSGRWHLSFRQHDPYLYGKARSVVLKANQPQAISVGGNAPETWPTATATPSGSTYTLGVENGQGIVIKAPFSGQKLTISFKTEKITVKPAVQNAEGLQIGSRFFPLAGRMTLIASSETTLSWRERWL